MTNYYNKRGQMDLSDRFAIETGISAKQSFKKITETIRRHPVTVAREVKENRTFLQGSFLECLDYSTETIKRYRFYKQKQAVK